MSVDVKVPTLGESITQATVARWLKQPGEAVKQDEPLVELETDKVTVEVPAPAAGVLAEVLAEEGAEVEVGALIARIEEGAEAGVAAPAPAEEPKQAEEEAPADASEPAGEQEREQEEQEEAPVPASQQQATPASPARAARISRQQALRQMLEVPPAAATSISGAASSAPGAASAASAGVVPQQVAKPPRKVPPEDAAREERVKMSRLRMTIARRLKEAQNTAAMLTTFNEVDMSAVIALRQRYRELFQRKHGVKLGFMSFFVRAVTGALKEIPQLNAEIDGDEIIYKNYYHVGVAVGTERGLVVPVVREADQLSLAEIEKAIADFAARARAGTLKLEEMTGGTFTITNGGVYGSLMSTPILNMPQTGILGMHKIMQRPMVMEDGGIEARPMMYLALTYDHRLVDGREAVTFLVRVKAFLEDPERLILDL